MGSSAKPALWTSIDRSVDFDRPWHETSIDVIVYSLAYCDAVFFSINKAILLALIFIDIQLAWSIATVTSINMDLHIADMK